MLNRYLVRSKRFFVVKKYTTHLLFLNHLFSICVGTYAFHYMKYIIQYNIAYRYNVIPCKGIGTYYSIGRVYHRDVRTITL